MPAPHARRRARQRGFSQTTFVLLIAAMLACFVLPAIPAVQDAGGKMIRENDELQRVRMGHVE